MGWNTTDDRDWMTGQWWLQRKQRLKGWQLMIFSFSISKF